MRNVLLVYKKSIYQIYFMERKAQLAASNHFTPVDVERLKQAHESHCEVMRRIRQILDDHGVRYREVYRARQIKYDPYDFVIAVGGDGTFIEASRQITTQTILGVNSDPERSVGFYCVANVDNFSDYLEAILAGRAQIRRLNRISLTINSARQPFSVMNEILVAHHFPAGMSRYRLRIGDVEEEQRGSGVWVSTAAGSTGAMHSAGGKPMPIGSKRLQYLPRELCRVDQAAHQLRGGMVSAGLNFSIHSLMREGMIFVDGAHLRIPLPFGSRLDIANSEHRLCAIAPSDGQ